MQGVAALIAVALVVSNPWALAVVALIALTTIAFLAWEYLRVPSWLEVAPGPTAPCASACSLEAKVDHLTAALVSARDEVATLRDENQRLHRDLRQAEAAAPSPRQAIFRRVGLDEDAPEWVVAAVQRAYRAKLHPDRYPPRLKEAAERRFKEAEMVFDQIGRERARGSA